MDYFLKGERQDYYVNKVMEEMKKVVPIVYRCCEGSEDGEAVVGCDANDEIRFWITFDPNERMEIDMCIEGGTLLEYIIDKNK